jgi:hypothetical protein
MKFIVSLVRSRLGGVVVSVLATGPKGRGLKPGRDERFLRVIKIRSTISLGLEVKPDVPCRQDFTESLRSLDAFQVVISKILTPSSIHPTCPRSLC